MQQLLPNPDLHVRFTHPKFNELAEAFIPGLKRNNPNGKFTAEAIAYGSKGRSDIKWNDYAGTFKVQIKDGDVVLGSIISCNLIHFTGNCGVKAISHIGLAPNWAGDPKAVGQLKDHPQAAAIKELLKVVESFAYHKLNCGWLLGSDTWSSYKGRTLAIVTELGENYHVSDKTWNPNYTWSKDHSIAFFNKDLNKAKHVDYWETMVNIDLPKGTTTASVK
jgi:hypothetical protein